jgi:hypothetical protein
MGDENLKAGLNKGSGEEQQSLQGYLAYESALLFTAPGRVTASSTW